MAVLTASQSSSGHFTCLGEPQVRPPQVQQCWTWLEIAKTCPEGLWHALKNSPSCKYSCWRRHLLLMFHWRHFSDTKTKQCHEVLLLLYQNGDGWKSVRAELTAKISYYAVVQRRRILLERGNKNSQSPSSLEGAKIKSQNLMPSEKIWRGVGFVAEIVVCWEGTMRTKWIVWSWEDTVDYSSRQLHVLLPALPFSCKISWNVKSIKRNKKNHQ